MKNTFHKLRLCRKQNQLTQGDIAFLLNLKENSSISRSEKGRQAPTIDLVMIYHLLFDIHIGTLFMDHRDKIRRRIMSRIIPLIKLIEAEPSSSRNQIRIKFLKDALERLKSMEV